MIHQADYHLHTANSFDSQADMASVCQNAINSQFQEVCFTEHFTLNPLVATYGHLSWSFYNSEIARCRTMFAGKLLVRQGVELCSPQREMSCYQEIFASQPLDYVLGSVHDVGNLKLRILLRNLGKAQAYSHYFAELLALAEQADIDGIGHLDLIKRYCGEIFSEQDLELHGPVIEKILQTMIRRGLVLEINTSTLGSLKETMPAENILRLYRSLGGTRINFGSDSHSGNSLGKGFAYAADLARRCGFETFSTFERRVGREWPLYTD